MSIRKFILGRIRSIQFAFEGWVTVLRDEKNTWVHAFFSLLSIWLGIWLKITNDQWILLILTIGMVWIAEFFNSAIEMMIDLISPEIHQSAKKSKDIGAAAVLIAAIASVVIGLIMFLPPFLQKFTDVLR